MENLKVPYGLDLQGELVAADDALKNNKYRCPSCNTELVLRSGEVRAKHFSHPTSSSCGTESILHITAKKLIEDTINANALGKSSIALKSECDNCCKGFILNIPVRTFTGSRQEVRVSEYICDVVGYRGDEIAIAIEILNTHKVDQNKSENLPVYWIELKAEDVLISPNEWAPVQGRLKASFCSSCKDHFKSVRTLCDSWNIDQNLYSVIKKPNVSFYVADLETCFNCKEDTPVFWWKGVPFCQSQPPSPRPYNVRYSSSKQYGGSYWANTCVNCNMVQGDNFLYLFDNAPFKGMPMATVIKKKEMVKIVTGKTATSEFMKVINRNI